MAENVTQRIGLAEGALCFSTFLPRHNFGAHSHSMPGLYVPPKRSFYGDFLIIKAYKSVYNSVAPQRARRLTS